MAASPSTIVKAEQLKWMHEHQWTHIPTSTYTPERIKQLLKDGKAGVWTVADIFLGAWKT